MGSPPTPAPAPPSERRAWLSAAALASVGGALAALALWGLVRQQQPQPGGSHMDKELLEKAVSATACNP